MSKHPHTSLNLQTLTGVCLFCVSVFMMSGCSEPAQSSTTSSPTTEKQQPDPLLAKGGGYWTMGPFTQGRLHIRSSSSDMKQGSITFFNDQGDSVRFITDEFAPHLPQQDSSEFLMRWNTDAALLSFEHADTICFQRILPFRDNKGIAAFRIEGNLFQVDSMSNGSLIPDPADVKIGYWGNALGPDQSKVASPWNARLAEMTHSQGVFLRMFGHNPSSEAQKPIGLSSKTNLELILSRQPDFSSFPEGHLNSKSEVVLAFQTSDKR